MISRRKPIRRKARQTPVKKLPKILWTPHKDIKGQCDRMWSEIIKILAGHKSEYSGKTENLNSHHIRGKENYRLRYELSNGMCLTQAEHGYIAHNESRRRQFEAFVKRVRGNDVFEKLDLIAGFQGKADIRAIRLYLESKLRDLKGTTK